MADSDTEKWALKSKQIEAERLKAARALANEKPDSSSLAFLDPKSTKVKGWSNDPDVIMATIERMGNRALIFAIAGITIGIIGYVGNMVAISFRLGAAGAMISSLPNGISLISLGIAVLLGLIVIGGELYGKFKHGKKLSSSFWTGLSAVIAVIVYYFIMTLILNLA